MAALTVLATFLCPSACPVHLQHKELVSSDLNSVVILSWLKGSSDAHMLRPVLSVKLSPLASGWSFHREEAMCRGKETLGEKMQNSTSWHCARSDWTGDVTVCRVRASFQATDRCSTAFLTEQSVVPRETARII